MLEPEGWRTPGKQGPLTQHQQTCMNSRRLKHWARTGLRVYHGFQFSVFMGFLSIVTQKTDFCAFSWALFLLFVLSNMLVFYLI